MRRNYLEKHADSLKAANVLDESKMWANSIHCAYYSVYQLMLHVIKEERISVRDHSLSGGWEGSHQRTINAVHAEMSSRKKTSPFKWKNEIEKLKIWRKTADYEIAYIDGDTTKVCIDYSISLSNQLKDTFGINE